MNTGLQSEQPYFRGPEDRTVDPANTKAKREKMFDKTIADSFPASDAPSSLPDPSEDSFSDQASGNLFFDTEKDVRPTQTRLLSECYGMNRDRFRRSDASTD